MKILLRSVLLTTALALIPSGQALAACGIGSAIWEGHDSFGAKALAFTTNILTHKSISTTFEISGCTEKDNIFKRASNDEIRYYAGKNLDHLAAEMARGSGEYLEAFAHVMDLEEQDLAAFCRLAQDHFAEFFPHDRTTSDEMLEALGRRMREHRALAIYVES